MALASMLGRILKGVETEQRHIVRVFLASPSDLMHERRAAWEVVERLNKNWAKKAFNLQIELMGWEETIGTFGRPPQENIDEDLAKCEIFIGMLWYEWGSANTGKYASGFEHEFRLAEEGNRNSKRPEIYLLFKEVDEARPGGAGPGYTRIKEFKNEIRQKVLWHQFSDETEFRDKLEGILADYIVRLHQAESDQQPKTASDDSRDSIVPAQQSNREDQPQLPLETLSFLRNFAEQASKSADDEPISPAELARFRLLGTLLAGEGNDDAMLGVYDANILFVHANELSLDRRECAELAECGIAHSGAQNIPYWRWLVAVGGLEGPFIPLRTVFGSDSLRIGALKLMRLMQIAKFESDSFDREFYVDRWLANKTPPAVRSAALGYLGEFGTIAELQKVRAEIARADYQTLKPAINAYARILLTQSAEASFGALIEHQSDTVEEKLLASIFARPATLPSALLEAAISNRAAAVRKQAAAELVARNQCTRQIADELVGDSEAEVRLEGLFARKALGDRISEDQARAVLVKRRIGAGFNALAMNYSSTEGDAQLELFLRQQRRAAPKAELKEIAKKAPIFEQTYVFEEIRRSFKSRGDELRAALRDEFVSWFAKELGKLEARVSDSDILGRTRKIEMSLRSQWMNEALAIVANQGDCQDLLLVRDLVATDEKLLTVEVVQFLARCGEWADVELVLQFSNPNPSKSIGLLGLHVPEEDLAFAANALLSLGATRVRDLLKLNMKDSIRARVVAGLNANQFRGLSDDDVAEMFEAEDEGVRQSAVLSAVAFLPVARLKALMKRHLDPSKKRFYNVGVWLDLGVSLDRAAAKKIAKRAVAAA